MIILMYKNGGKGSNSKVGRKVWRIGSSLFEHGWSGLLAGRSIDVDCIKTIVIIHLKPGNEVVNMLNLFLFLLLLTSFSITIICPFMVGPKIEVTDCCFAKWSTRQDVHIYSNWYLKNCFPMIKNSFSQVEVEQ